MRREKLIGMIQTVMETSRWGHAARELEVTEVTGIQ
jgi:hypothetical protein